MIYPCNFKSKVFHEDSRGCDLTSEHNVCPGEQKCVLYQLYSILSEMQPVNPEEKTSEPKQTITVDTS